MSSSRPSQHDAEETIRQIERWLAGSVTSVGDAVVGVDAAGRISYFNPAAERMTGWTRAQAVGASYRDVIRIVQRGSGGPVCDPVANARQTGVLIHLDDGPGLVTRAGDVVPIHHCGAPIRTATGEITGVVLVLRDASNEQKPEAERRLIERKMQDAQKLESLGVLAGGVAHDFNNLLTAIIGNTEVAEMELSPNHPVRDHLDAVKHAARRAADLCRQMLAYAGEGGYFAGHINLTSVVRETATLLKVAVGSAAELRLELEGEVPLVKADPALLQQLMMNLVTNAAEAIQPTAHGVITVTTGFARYSPDLFSTSALAPESPVSGYVYLEVADNGIGMTPETTARMWDPFFTTKFAGRGLGLSAVHGIVRTSGGAVTVTSQPGRGSTFRVYFPTVDDALAPPAPAGGPAATPSAPAGAWILIIDDEEPVRSLLEKTVRTLGYRGVAVATAEAAFAAAQIRPQPALVLLDASMPGIDTVGLAARIRTTNADQRIVVMSGFIEAQALARFEDVPVSEFLQKPFTRDEIAALVTRGRSDRAG